MTAWLILLHMRYTEVFFLKWYKFPLFPLNIIPWKKVLFPTEEQIQLRRVHRAQIPEISRAAQGDDEL